MNPQFKLVLTFVKSVPNTPPLQASTLEEVELAMPLPPSKVTRITGGADHINIIWLCSSRNNTTEILHSASSIQDDKKEMIFSTTPQASTLEEVEPAMPLPPSKVTLITGGAYHIYITWLCSSLNNTTEILHSASSIQDDKKETIFSTTPQASTLEEVEPAMPLSPSKVTGITGGADHINITWLCSSRNNTTEILHSASSIQDDKKETIFSTPPQASTLEEVEPAMPLSPSDRHQDNWWVFHHHFKCTPYQTRNHEILRLF